LNQPYFIVVLAHSLHGRLRRVHIPYQFVYVVLALALFGGVSLFGFVSSYLRMSLKVANYNTLRQEVDTLRARYHRLEKESKQTDQQLASLQLLASEVSMAYGLKRHLEGPADITNEGRLTPTVSESLEEYNFLKSASFSPYSRKSRALFPGRGLPSIWPVDGRLMSHFGSRTDPFSGEGAFHTGVDISATTGTLVKAAGDGIVTHAEYSGHYGKLVILDHGNGFQTYYAHLSRFNVVAGQGIRRGETVGMSGATGRVTSPHLHYEVRRGGTAVNPYQYLHAPVVAQAQPKADFGF
jgi:murein DD-endopeptidase MepM/ murein hydrolase activator NlpD